MCQLHSISQSKLPLWIEKRKREGGKRHKKRKGKRGMRESINNEEGI